MSPPPKSLTPIAASASERLSEVSNLGSPTGPSYISERLNVLNNISDVEGLPEKDPL